MLYRSGLEACEPQRGAILDADVRSPYFEFELVAISSHSLVPLDCDQLLTVVISISINRLSLSLGDASRFARFPTPVFYGDGLAQPHFQRSITRAKSVLKEAPVPSLKLRRQLCFCFS